MKSFLEVKRELETITGDFKDIMHLDPGDIYFLYSKVAKSGRQILDIQDVDNFIKSVKNKGKQNAQ